MISICIKGICNIFVCSKIPYRHIKKTKLILKQIQYKQELILQNDKNTVATENVIFIVLAHITYISHDYTGFCILNLG